MMDGVDSRLRVGLGARGLSARLAASHFDGFGLGGLVLVGWVDWLEGMKSIDRCVVMDEWREDGDREEQGRRVVGGQLA